MTEASGKDFVMGSSKGRTQISRNPLLATSPPKNNQPPTTPCAQVPEEVPVPYPVQKIVDRLVPYPVVRQVTKAVDVPYPQPYDVPVQPVDVPYPVEQVSPLPTGVRPVVGLCCSAGGLGAQGSGSI